MIPGPRAHITAAKNTAKAEGKKTYEGRPCSSHIGVYTRWVSNGCCIECSKKHLKPYRERNATKIKEARQVWDSNNPVKAMLQRARRRAKNLGLKFNLTPEDLVIPEVCPILGMPLIRGVLDRDSSPSLERIDNNIGYIKGNVIVISFKANRIKNNATISELRKVVDFYEQNYGKSYS